MNIIFFHAIFDMQYDDGTSAERIQDYLKNDSMLSNATDHQGRRAVDMASIKNRDIIRKFIFFCGRYHITRGPPIFRSVTTVVVRADDYDVEKDFLDVFTSHLNEQETKFPTGNNYLSLKNIKRALEDLAGRGFQKANEIFFDYEMLLRNGTTPENMIFDYFGRIEITKVAFLERCRTIFGEFRTVAIKFMMDEEQYKREIIMRKSTSVLSKVLDSMYVVNLLNSPDQSVFQAAMETLVIGVKDSKIELKAYKYGVVMPVADSSLEAIYRSEKPDEVHVRAIMKEVAEALQHCHENGIIHCDLKMPNIVRINGRMRLTNFCAAHRFNTDNSPIEVSATSTFSSGVLPPEMFYKLKSGDEERLKEYWACDGVDIELRRKILPMKTLKGTSYCVKTSQNVDNCNTDNLPYELIQATPQLDMWSLGIMLYTLCVGDMMQLSRDGDVYESIDIERIASWNEQNFEDLLGKKLLDHGASKMLNNLTIDLLLVLLKTDPKERPCSMQDILEHPYFLLPYERMNADSKTLEKLKKIDDHTRNIFKIAVKTRDLVTRLDSQTIQMDDVSANSLIQIHKTDSVLMRGMILGGEISIPSTFIIVNQKLHDFSSELSTPMSDVLTDRLSVAKAKSVQFLRKLAAVGIVINSAVKSPDEKNILSAVEDLLADEKLFLYLIDERTMEAVVLEEDPIYPIVINTSTDRQFVRNVLPLMMIGLKAVAVVHGLSGIARLLGYPLPSVPQECLDIANYAVGNLSKRSSIIEFDTLQRTLNGRHGGPVPSDEELQKSIRGAALREWVNYLLLKDRDCTFSGLQRVLTPEGMSCWTTREGADMMMNDGRWEMVKGFGERHQSGEKGGSDKKKNGIKEKHVGQISKLSSVESTPSPSSPSLLFVPTGVQRNKKIPLKTIAVRTQSSSW